MSGSGAHLDRYLEGTHSERGRDARHVLAAVIAALAVIGGAGIAMADEHLPPGQNSDFAAYRDAQTGKNSAAPRLYVPLHPADPAEVEKQFAIGRSTAFGVQSEELIRPSRNVRDHLPSASGGDANLASPVPALPDGGVK